MLAHGVLERADREEHDGDEIHEDQIREADEDDDGERGRHAAAPPRPSRSPVDVSRLGRLTVALAAGLVDALEQRAARVVACEEVDEADVLQHLRGAVPRERIVVSEDREQRRHGVGAHPAQRVLGRRSHPPALVREETRDRRRSLGSDDVTGGARRVDADEPFAVVEPCDECGADVLALPRSESLDHGRTDVRVGVPGELHQRRLTEIRVRTEQRRAPEAHGRIPVAEERQKPRARSRSEPLELRRDARALTFAAAESVDEQVYRPVVPDVAERANRGGGDHRIGVGEHRPDQPRDRRVVSLFETLQGPNAPPSAPLACGDGPSARRTRRRARRLPRGFERPRRA